VPLWEETNNMALGNIYMALSEGEAGFEESVRRYADKHPNYKTQIFGRLKNESGVRH
jgi:hypothetical protein